MAHFLEGGKHQLASKELARLTRQRFRCIFDYLVRINLETPSVNVKINAIRVQNKPNISIYFALFDFLVSQLVDGNTQIVRGGLIQKIDIRIKKFKAFFTANCYATISIILCD